METKQTQSSIENIARYWIDNLGLQTWDIRLVWGEELDDWYSGGFDSHASCWRSRDYEQGRLYVNPKEYECWTDREAHLHICHELLHMVTKEVEYVIDHIEGKLSKEADGLVTKAHQHHVEGVVDKLAYRFVELAGIK